MALILFVGSDYTSGGLSVAYFLPEIYTCSGYKTFFIMRTYSARIFCFVSTTTNCYSICFSRNCTIVFYNYNIRNPGLGFYNMIFPCVLMCRSLRLCRSLGLRRRRADGLLFFGFLGLNRFLSLNRLFSLCGFLCFCRLLCLNRLLCFSRFLVRVRFCCRGRLLARVRFCCRGRLRCPC